MGQHSREIDRRRPAETPGPDRGGTWRFYVLVLIYGAALTVDVVTLGRVPLERVLRERRRHRLERWVFGRVVTDETFGRHAANRETEVHRRVGRARVEES